MGNTNRGLTQAAKKKKDEFYTRMTDIEKEMYHYRSAFKGKTVLCNCDDPYESNFFRYFALNFETLGLKKLICTCYATSPVMYTQLSLFDDDELLDTGRKSYKAVITGIMDKNGDGRIDLDDIALMLKENPPELLDGNGDFRSKECIEILNEADIVVTNPPFSLFTEYLLQLIQYGKKFIIMGNQNASTYKEIFPLIKGGDVWYGASIHGNGRYFRVPDDYPLDAAFTKIDNDGYRYVSVKGVRWFTNIDYGKRHEDLILYKLYSPEEYPRFDNYDAINIDKAGLIPVDYDGVMGVPITFLDKFNPDQFEILGTTESEGKGLSNGLWLGGAAQPVVAGKKKYKRLFIRRKK